MAIDKIELGTPPRVPFDENAYLSGNPQRVAEAQRQLAHTLQDYLDLVRIFLHKLLDLSQSQAYYFGLPDADGVYPEGTFRIYKTDNGLEVQKLIGEVWTKRVLLSD